MQAARLPIILLDSGRFRSCMRHARSSQKYFILTIYNYFLLTNYNITNHLYAVTSQYGEKSLLAINAR